MTERPRQIEPNDERKPFKIRGHHMFFFQALELGETTPHKKAEKLRKDISQNPNKKYKEDVVGKTIEQADTYQQKLENQFNKFINLPDDYPVKLVSGQKDGMCHSCTTGNHCSISAGWTSDEHFLYNFFVKKAERLGGDYTISGELVNFSDIGQQETRTITTTAGVLRNVFRNGEKKS